MIWLESFRLNQMMRRVLSARHVNDTSTHHVVSSLIQTSLRGIDSHGINLFPHYCQAVEHGRINPAPDIRVDHRTPGTAILDADGAFGHHAGAMAMDLAVQNARANGIAAVAVRRSSHFGAAAYFGLRAAESDCIGLAFTNADALVKAHGSRERFFGTNPVCCCAPMATEGPFSLDMATSLANWNKVNEAKRARRPIPAEWAFDADGKSVSDPNAAYSLAPAGSYKGFGLGMMVDIFCALLAGGPISRDIPGMYTAPLNTRRDVSHFFVAIDISTFVPVETFKRRLQQMADAVRALPSAGEDEPMVAGDPEKRIFVSRVATGIPMDEGKFDEYLALSNEFDDTRVKT